MICIRDIHVKGGDMGDMIKDGAISIVDDNKSIESIKNVLSKRYSKAKLKFFKDEKKSFEETSEIKGAALSAIKFGFNKVIEELEHETDPTKITKIMKNLQSILSSKELKNLQQVCSANLYNLRKIADNEESVTLSVKAKGGVLSSVFGNIKKVGENK